MFPFKKNWPTFVLLGLPIIWMFSMSLLIFEGLQQLKLQSTKIDEVIEQVTLTNTSYYLNVETYSAEQGLTIYFIPVDSKSLQGANWEFDRQVSGSFSSCESTGTCEDSVKLFLYKDSPDTVLVIRDTSLYAPQ